MSVISEYIQLEGEHEKLKKLLRQIGKSICDKTVGQLNLENNDEEFGALVCLSHLQRKYLRKIIEVTK